MEQTHTQQDADSLINWYQHSAIYTFIPFILKPSVWFWLDRTSHVAMTTSTRKSVAGGVKTDQEAWIEYQSWGVEANKCQHISHQESFYFIFKCLSFHILMFNCLQ